MQAYFRHFQRLAEAGAYSELAGLPVPKPEFFNWTTDILEGLHVAERPDQPALVLADDAGSQTISYAELAARANQLLNFWRGAGVRPAQAVLLMVPVCAELWDTYVAGIKGGQLLIPAASILTVSDLEYRFSRLLPAVVIADAENAAKIDAAEQTLGQRIGLKMLVGNAGRAGWVGFAGLAKLPPPPGPPRHGPTTRCFYSSPRAPPACPKW